MRASILVPVSERLLWYVAYGSNMSAGRLRCYLAGGVPPGGRRHYPGCRDTRPPRRTAPVLLPGGVHFAGESAVWSGGLAFYDPATPGPAAARGYLITAAQLADIVAQEMHRPPGTGPDPRLLGRGDLLRLGPGRYETLIRVGHRDGHPMLTFTAPWRAGDVAANPPAPAYLAVMARGLHEAHGWDAGRIAGYLADRPGVRGGWRRDDLSAVVTAAIAAA